MATFASMQAVMKDIYRPKNMQNVTYKDRPFTGMVTKFEGFGGYKMPVMVNYGNPQGIGSVFATAQSNVTDSKKKRFEIETVDKFGFAHISTKAAKTTQKEKYAFVKGLKDEVDTALAAFADTLESDGFRSGTGSLGQISSGSTVTNQTITLADINDVTNFEPGMSLVASTADGGALRNSGAAEVLAAVNRSTGVLTATSAQWDTTITAIATTDYLYRETDAANGGSNVCVSGLAGWGPDISSSIPSTSFFGVDRSDDSRLVFTYHDGSSSSIPDALLDACIVTAREGGMVKKILINHVKYRKLVKQLGSSVEYSKSPARDPMGSEVATVGFSGVKIHGVPGDGAADVIPANKCQSDIAWGIDPEYVCWASTGPLIQFDDIDGNRLLRRATASGVEARLVSYSNVACNKPVHNFRCAL